MSGLRLLVKDPYRIRSNYDLVYFVTEEADGSLRWKYDTEAPARPNALVMPRAQHCHGLTVTTEEAELITGMWAPAALDRLRELVHDSTDLFV